LREEPLRVSNEAEGLGLSTMRCTDEQKVLYRCSERTDLIDTHNTNTQNSAILEIPAGKFATSAASLENQHVMLFTWTVPAHTVSTRERPVPSALKHLPTAIQ